MWAGLCGRVTIPLKLGPYSSQTGFFCADQKKIRVNIERHITKCLAAVSLEAPWPSNLSNGKSSSASYYSMFQKMSHKILNILYSCKSVAMKFSMRYPGDLSY